MTYAERAQRWNEWYDGLPDRWRFQVVLWPLLLLGTINMVLTISNGFPFGLLVILGILLLAVVRVPYLTGRRPARGGEQPERTVHLGRVDWAWGLNQRYDAMPEWRRFWVFPAVLVVAGAINMALTLANGFPFALLFLLALLVMVAIRAPYAWGWLTPPPGRAATAAPSLRVARDTTPSMPAFAPLGGAPAPEHATPEHLASEHLASEHNAPEPLASEPVAARPMLPENLVPERVVSEDLVPEHLVPEQRASEHLAFEEQAFEERAFEQRASIPDHDERAIPNHPDTPPRAPDEPARP